MEIQDLLGRPIHSPEIKELRCQVNGILTEVGK